MGLFELIGRTKLVIAVIAAVIASGMMVVMVTTEVQGNVAIGLLIALGFAGVSVFVAWQAIRDIRIWRAVQASPVPVDAVVQEIRSVSSRPPRYALEYRYQDSTGGEHVGRSFPLSSAEAGHWRPFDVAQIIFNSASAGAEHARKSAAESPPGCGISRRVVLPAEWLSPLGSASG